MRAEIPKIAAGEEVPAPPRLAVKAESPGAGVLDSFAGSYDFNGTELQVQREGEMLWIGDSALVPVGKDEFFAYRDCGQVTATRDEKGELSGLVWHSGGWSSRCPRCAEGASCPIVIRDVGIQWALGLKSPRATMWRANGCGGEELGGDTA